MMKRFIALLLCIMMAFALVACNDKKDNDDGEGGGSSSGTKKSSVSFYVNYNSVKIELGADAKAAVSALGTPKSTSPMGNCGGQGTLTKYTYTSFEIYTLTAGNAETVDQITLLDDAIKSPEGVGIGSSVEDVLKACGSNPTSKSDTGITYTSGSKNLIFSLRDGSVVGVDYRVIG